MYHCFLFLTFAICSYFATKMKTRKAFLSLASPLVLLSCFASSLYPGVDHASSCFVFHHIAENCKPWPDWTIGTLVRALNTTFFSRLLSHGVHNTTRTSRRRQTYTLRHITRATRDRFRNEPLQTILLFNIRLCQCTDLHAASNSSHICLI